MDIVVTGDGAIAAACREVLATSGLRLGRDLDSDGRCPVILGEGLSFAQAMQVVESGRHVLVAGPAVYEPAHVAALAAARRPRRALMFASGRRQHPAYHLLSGLSRSHESDWRPRYLRLTTLSTERPSGALLRWRTSETLAIALELAGRTPLALRACGASGPPRAALDFLALTLDFGDAEAFIHVGLGEGLTRREAVFAARERRAYIDELDPAVPVRLVDDGAALLTHARGVSCPAPGALELARRQCLAFLDATTLPARCRAEADLWLKVSGCWQAVEASLAERGATVAINEPSAPAARPVKRPVSPRPSAAPSLRVV